MIKFINRNLTAIVFLSIGLFYMLWCIDFGNLQFGDLGDSRFNNWVLEYFYTALSSQSSSFKTSNFLYPLINNMLLSDNHWFAGIFYSFFRFINFDQYKSYSILLMVESSLNFISCYYVLRKFNLSRNSSAIGAFIFSFNTMILIKISHSQLHFKAFIPLAILFVFQYFKKRNFKYLCLVIFCVSLQLMISSYLGMFLIIYLIIIILTIMGQFKIKDFKKFLPIKYSPKTSIPLLVLSLLCFSIYFFPYFYTINLYNLKFILTIGVPFELNAILFSKHSPLFIYFSELFQIEFSSKNIENNLFLGIGVWLTVILSIFAKNYHKFLEFSHKKIFLATAITILFFLMNKYLPTFYLAQLYIPGFNNLRVENRFFYVVFFGVILATAKFLHYLELKNNRKSKIIYYILVLIILIEAFLTKYHFSDHKSQEKNIAEYQELAKKYAKPDSILLFTFSNKFLQNRDYVIENINLQFAFLKQPQQMIINGYTGHMLMEINFANDCSNAENIVIKNEKKINKIFNNNFKYDRDKLVIFNDNKICK